MNVPEVAVVIPAFNSAEWIAETLDSVARQRYPLERIELIVVDDGSTDGTVELVRKLGNPGFASVAIIETTGNLGPSAARNRGWTQAKAPWVQFLDADDLLHAEKLSRHAEAATKVDANVAVIYSDWQRLFCVDGRWSPIEGTRRPEVGRDPTSELLTADHFIATGSQLFARQWLAKVNGWDESLRLVEDVDLMMRIAESGGLFHKAASVEPLFSYRHRAQSLSLGNREAFVNACLRNARKAAAGWQVKGGLTPLRKSRLVDVFVQASRERRPKSPKEADALLAEAESLAPGGLPTAPRGLRLLARAVGIRRAERWATSLREARKLLRPSKPVMGVAS